MPDYSASTENNAVERYLQYLATGNLPELPGHEARVAGLDTRIANEPRLHIKVRLIAQRQALVAGTVDPEVLIDNFVKYAGGFSQRCGVTYAAWLEMGVPAGVLKQAGLSRAGMKKERIEGEPRRAYRNSPTPDFTREYLTFLMEHGPDETAEHFGYVRNYVITAANRLSKKFPKVASQVGYKISPKGGQPKKQASPGT